MPKTNMVQVKKEIASEITRVLTKAPRGKPGARGTLAHLQDPKYITTDAQLLMTRPTMRLTRLVEVVSNRKAVSRPLVKIVVGETESAGVIGISKSRKIKGIPTLIPIKYERDFRTQNIGTFRDGQFVGFSFSHSREMSVLHIFDKFGFHVKSEAWDSEADCDPKAELKSAIDRLFRPYPGDVAVQLFTVELLGMEFGLKKTGEDHVEYVPLLLGFDPPWDGYYNT